MTAEAVVELKRAECGDLASCRCVVWRKMINEEMEGALIHPMILPLLCHSCLHFRCLHLAVKVLNPTGSDGRTEMDSEIAPAA